MVILIVVVHVWDVAFRVTVAATTVATVANVAVIQDATVIAHGKITNVTQVVTRVATNLQIVAATPAAITTVGFGSPLLGRCRLCDSANIACDGKLHSMEKSNTCFLSKLA